MQNIINLLLALGGIEPILMLKPEWISVLLEHTELRIIRSVPISHQHKVVNPQYYSNAIKTASVWSAM